MRYYYNHTPNNKNNRESCSRWTVAGRAAQGHTASGNRPRRSRLSGAVGESGGEGACPPVDSIPATRPSAAYSCSILAFTRDSFTSRLLCTNQPSVHSLPPPTCIAHPGAIRFHNYWTVYDFLLTSRLYAIHRTILIMAISCKGQALPYSTFAPAGTRSPSGQRRCCVLAHPSLHPPRASRHPPPRASPARAPQGASAETPAARSPAPAPPPPLAGLALR